ncbi:hypothetical protein [Kamptonema formosum]|uniref:hypothetical protein n=1 Tax=Kamptonema formosum TaxID=331992 RepID=UPI00034DBA71|nr:hypothetical protein [Oscillatoria sp. PCC 10802]
MPKVNFRKLHRQIAPILFLPLFITAITGIAYRLGKSWFGMSPDVAEIFMVIHQGEFLGSQLKPVYVLLNGVGLVGLAVTGLSMTGIFRPKRPKPE